MIRLAQFIAFIALVGALIIAYLAYEVRPKPASTYEAMARHTASGVEEALAFVPGDSKMADDLERTVLILRSRHDDFISIREYGRISSGIAIGSSIWIAALLNAELRRRKEQAVGSGVGESCDSG